MFPENKKYDKFYKVSKVLFFSFLCYIEGTVKPVLSGHSKIDKTKVLKTIGSLMKVESIAECSKILSTCIKR